MDVLCQHDELRRMTPDLTVMSPGASNYLPHSRSALGLPLSVLDRMHYRPDPLRSIVTDQPAMTLSDAVDEWLKVKTAAARINRMRQIELVALQDLLDEWIVAHWQNRAHDGLRHPLTPGKAY